MSSYNRRTRCRVGVNDVKQLKNPKTGQNPFLKIISFQNKRVQIVDITLTGEDITHGSPHNSILANHVLF